MSTECQWVQELTNTEVYYTLSTSFYWNLTYFIIPALLWKIRAWSHVCICEFAQTYTESSEKSTVLKLSDFSNKIGVVVVGLNVFWPVNKIKTHKTEYEKLIQNKVAVNFLFNLTLVRLHFQRGLLSGTSECHTLVMVTVVWILCKYTVC